MAPLRFVCRQWREGLLREVASAIQNKEAFVSSLDLYKWSRDALNMPLTTKTREAVVGSSPLDVVEHLFKDLSNPNFSFNARDAELAAKGGKIETLQWLLARDPPCPWSEETCTGAAKGGHLQILQWLRAQDPPCPWDKWTCGFAAYNNHIHILRWCREQDPPCPWGVEVCAMAAGGGHLNVLQWLRSQNPPCPWNKGALTGAIECDHMHVLHWLRSQNPPCPER